MHIRRNQFTGAGTPTTTVTIATGQYVDLANHSTKGYAACLGHISYFQLESDHNTSCCRIRLNTLAIAEFTESLRFVEPGNSSPLDVRGITCAQIGIPSKHIDDTMGVQDRLVELTSVCCQEETLQPHATSEGIIDALIAYLVWERHIHEENGTKYSKVAAEMKKDALKTARPDIRRSQEGVGSGTWIHRWLKYEQYINYFNQNEDRKLSGKSLGTIVVREGREDETPTLPENEVLSEISGGGGKTPTSDPTSTAIFASGGNAPT
ncbi:hypothetical protein EDB19DRAFT_1835896 [Suillus lakei]|nr:hypothetical protein EDB19DRAFT_1835896 [Suillus lakei]